MSGGRLDLDQTIRPFQATMMIDGTSSLCRASRTGQRAFDKAASLLPLILLDEGEAALSGRAPNESSRRNSVPRLSVPDRTVFRLRGIRHHG
jgi:hypothetical protein